MALALADFYRRVAEDIGLLGEGIPFEDSDSQLITNTYQEVYAELEVEDLVDWGSSDSIPDEYVSSSVDMVGARVAPKFHLPEINMTWEQKFAAGQQRLRRLVTRRWRSTTIPATYY